MLFWLAVALAKPLTMSLTPAETAQLNAGDVVVRSPDSSGRIYGAIDIPADHEAVWGAVMDFPARVESVGALKSIDVYAPATDPGGLGAKFVLSILGSEVVYHLRYELSPTEGWCTFTLDPAKPNDILKSDGGYLMEDLNNGKQRVFYYAITETKQSVPSFIRNSLAYRSIKNQLTEMRTRASK